MSSTKHNQEPTTGPKTYLEQGRTYQLSILDSSVNRDPLRQPRYQTRVAVCYDPEQYDAAHCEKVWAWNNGGTLGPSTPAIEHALDSGHGGGQPTQSRLQISEVAFDSFRVDWSSNQVTGGSYCVIPMRLNLLPGDLAGREAMDGKAVTLFVQTRELPLLGSRKVPKKCKEDYILNVELFAEGFAERKYLDDCQQDTRSNHGSITDVRPVSAFVCTKSQQIPQQDYSSSLKSDPCMSITTTNTSREKYTAKASPTTSEGRKEPGKFFPSQSFTGTDRLLALCFYVRLEDTSNVRHRAIYPPERSMGALFTSISTKFDIPIESIGDIIYFNTDFVQIAVDEDVIQQLPDGQDVVMHVRNQERLSESVGTVATALSSPQFAITPSYKAFQNAPLQFALGNDEVEGDESFRDLIDFDWEHGVEAIDQCHFTKALQLNPSPDWYYDPQETNTITQFEHDSWQVEEAQDPSNTPLLSFSTPLQTRRSSDDEILTVDKFPQKTNLRSPVNDGYTTPETAEKTTRKYSTLPAFTHTRAEAKPFTKAQRRSTWTQALTTHPTDPIPTSPTAPSASSTSACPITPTSPKSGPKRRAQKVANLPPERANAMREKNRVAAQKCRTVRIAKTENLKITSHEMIAENTRLKALKLELEAESQHLRELLEGHGRCCGEAKCDGDHADVELDTDCDLRALALRRRSCT